MRPALLAPPLSWMLVLCAWPSFAGAEVQLARASVGGGAGIFNGSTGIRLAANLGQPGTGISHGDDAVLRAGLVEQPVPVRAPQVSGFDGAILSDRSPVLPWEGVHGASSYVISIADNEAFSDETLVTISATQHTVPTELEPGTYCWRVKALGRLTESAYSAVDVFTITAPATPPPVDTDVHSGTVTALVDGEGLCLDGSGDEDVVVSATQVTRLVGENTATEGLRVELETTDEPGAADILRFRTEPGDPAPYEIELYGRREPVAEGPISLTVSGASGTAASPGATHQVALRARDLADANGWWVTIEYDPAQVDYVEGSFESAAAGTPTVVRERAGVIIVGVEGGTSVDEQLGTLTFQFAGTTAASCFLTVTEVSIDKPAGRDQLWLVEESTTVARDDPEPPIVVEGDFDGSGALDTGDFFAFVDAFGQPDPLYDLDGSGVVGVTDFFLFVDLFGANRRGKILALGADYLGIPQDTSLEPNYPNPFNASTVLTYQLAAAGPLALEIYDALGQKVKVLEDDVAAAGTYRAVWDGTDNRGAGVGAGVYIARLRTPEGHWIRKMTLVK